MIAAPVVCVRHQQAQRAFVGFVRAAGHRALGVARMTTTAQTLSVTNIGSSGPDGVSAVLDGAIQWTGGIPPLPAPMEIGGTAEEEQVEGSMEDSGEEA